MGKIISNANQKGGVGKTSLNIILASDLFHEKKKSVVYLDIDYLQGTAKTKRENEIAEIIQTEKASFEKIKGPGSFTKSIEKAVIKEFEDNNYPIVCLAPDKLESSIPALVDEFDYVIIDFPGNLETAGVMKFYKLVDFVFIVTNITEFDLESTMKYIQMYNQIVVPARKKMELDVNLYGVLNKVKANQSEFKDFIKEIDNMPISFLKAFVPDSVKIQREITTMNFVGGKNYKKGDPIYDYCNEIYSIIK